MAEDGKLDLIITKILKQTLKKEIKTRKNS